MQMVRNQLTKKLEHRKKHVRDGKELNGNGLCLAPEAGLGENPGDPGGVHGPNGEARLQTDAQ